MTKAFASAAFVGIALVDCSVALAAPPPPAPMPVNWSGFYLGGEVGSLNSNIRYSGGLVGSISPSTTAGGIFGGYNYQLPNNFVIGGEVRYDWTRIDATYTTLNTKTDYVGSMALRVGYAFNTVMPYATFGGAFTNQIQTFPAIADTSTRSGWTYGAGIEVDLGQLFGQTPAPSTNVRSQVIFGNGGPAWIGRVDYRHTHYNKADTFGDLHTALSTDAVFVGFATRFGTR